MAAENLMHETIFVNKSQAEDDMCLFQTVKTGGAVQTKTVETVGIICMAYSSAASSILQQIADARKEIQNSLNGVQQPVSCTYDISKELQKLKSDNDTLIKNYNDLKVFTTNLEKKVNALEERLSSSSVSDKKVQEKAQESEEDDDDFELFGDGEDDEENSIEAEKIKQDRINAYNEKKSKKVAIVAKSNVILDIKPWDDETDLNKMEEFVRGITMDGLLWGASKKVPLAYGIKKLQISTVIEDDKVSVDLLEELICANEDFVQSVDIAAFNKI